MKSVHVLVIAFLSLWIHDDFNNNNNDNNSDSNNNFFFVSAQTKSYQQRATEWGVANPQPGANVIQASFRYALACLWFSSNRVATPYTQEQLTGPIAGWVRTTNWMTTKSVCTWYGITCRNGIVVKIDLSDNRLTGYIPNEISILGPGLEYLDLSDNPIASVGAGLSWMNAMVQLRHLDLYFCNIDYGSGIPPYISSMVNLELLDLSYCFLQGDLDGVPFAPLRKLVELNLGGNYFEGSPIPTQILSLPNLRRLNIENANVADNFPRIARTVNKKISLLWLDDNSLDGSIPPNIQLVTGLTSLSLSGSGLVGRIPTQMGNMANLQGLWLYNNSLTGAIPASLGNLRKLTTLQTEDNVLRGTMPQAICNLKNTGSKLLKQLSTDCVGTNPEVQCATTCCNCCQSPCFQSTTGTGFGFCFSGNNMVHVRRTMNDNQDDYHTKMIRMDQLQIGDYVLTNSRARGTGTGIHADADADKRNVAEYSKVYSFGHYSNGTMADYLQLYSQNLDRPLEVSSDHMVFVAHRGAIPASAVQIGDELVLVDVVAAMKKEDGHDDDVHSTAVVTKITTVQRKGAYAPFTESGTIVVNQVLASNYVSLQAPSEYFMIDMKSAKDDANNNKNNNIPIVSMHWLAHAFQAPHRIMCRVMSDTYCNKESYTSDGTSYWVAGPHLVSQWILQQPTVIMTMLVIPILATGTFFHLTECIMNMNTMMTIMTALMMVGGIMVWQNQQPARRRTMKKKASP